MEQPLKNTLFDSHQAAIAKTGIRQCSTIKSIDLHATQIDMMSRRNSGRVDQAAAGSIKPYGFS
ncbi:hypothetical protein [Parasphingorhabdus sp.]|uniref:hypothetical protein n=1 Tax=Parasphingorhabdus sp. TaxID=2709688 RepID=UPI003BAFCC26